MWFCKIVFVQVLELHPFSGDTDLIITFRPNCDGYIGRKMHFHEQKWRLSFTNVLHKKGNISLLILASLRCGYLRCRSFDKYCQIVCLLYTKNTTHPAANHSLPSVTQEVLRLCLDVGFKFFCKGRVARILFVAMVWLRKCLPRVLSNSHCIFVIRLMYLCIICTHIMNHE